MGVSRMTSYNTRKVMTDIVVVSLNLFKIMIPTLIIVKIATELGLDALLISLFSPMMSLMGLPSSAAIVLVTTLLTNPYTGLIVAASLPEMAHLTMAQSSIMALFMLFTHGLPLEAMISSKVGIRLWVVVALRLATAFIFGILLAQFFIMAGWYQAPALVTLPLMHAPDPSLSAWLVGQAIALFMIQIVIIILIALLELLRVLGIERLMIWLLSPVLRLMGIGPHASTIAIVGVSLGLTFGSGILMRDVQSGTIPKKDVYGVLCFLNLKHSLFEDTAVVMLLGPSLFVIVVLRLVISVIVTILMMALGKQLNEAQWHRYLTNKNIPKEAG